MEIKHSIIYMPLYSIKWTPLVFLQWKSHWFNTIKKGRKTSISHYGRCCMYCVEAKFFSERKPVHFSSETFSSAFLIKYYKQWTNKCVYSYRLHNFMQIIGQNHIFLFYIVGYSKAIFQFFHMHKMNNVCFFFLFFIWI